MADDFISLTDLVNLNDLNAVDLGVSDLLDDAPLLKALAADIASNGTQHKYQKETGAPVVGFRAPNEGRDLDSSQDTLVTITLKILDATFGIDKAIADSYRGGPQALVARELRRHLKAAFSHAEKQLINGTGNDSAGFTGLVDASTLDGLADAMVVNAGGATACSSVYLIRTNGDGIDCTAILGQDGVIDVAETHVELIEDGSGKKFPAYVTPATGWLGLQIGSIYSVGRIANLAATTYTLNDDMIYDALSRFPSSRQPNLIAMNRRSLKQLRESRTATNATGAAAPRPTEVEGIPIVQTDSILSSETAVA